MVYIYSRKKSLALEYNEKNSTHAMFFIVFVMKPTGIFCCESRSWLFFNHWIDPWDRRFYERITGSLFSPTAGPQPPASTSLTCASCVTTHQRFTRSPRFFAIVQLMSSIRWHGCLWMTRYCSMKYLEVSWSILKFCPSQEGFKSKFGPLDWCNKSDPPELSHVRSPCLRAMRMPHSSPSHSIRI